MDARVAGAQTVPSSWRTTREGDQRTVIKKKFNSKISLWHGGVTATATGIDVVRLAETARSRQGQTKLIDCASAEKQADSVLCICHNVHVTGYDDGRVSLSLCALLCRSVCVPAAITVVANLTALWPLLSAVCRRLRNVHVHRGSPVPVIHIVRRHQ